MRALVFRSASVAALVASASACLIVACSKAPAPAEGPEASASVGAEPVVRVVLLTGVRSVTFVSGGALFLDWAGGEGATWAGGGDCRIYCASGGGEISAEGPGGAVLDLGHGPLDLTSSHGVLKMEGRDYRGGMRAIRESDGTLTVIDLVGLESYLRGVLPSEIGALSEDRMAAMKAQAVASRSYTMYKMARSRDRSYDVVSGVGDQVYKGVSGERGITDRAVAETFGEVAAYRGEPIRANFSSTCGGVTVDNDEAWPDEEPLPYLRSVRDVSGRRGAELCEGSNHHRWRVEWSAEELASILSSHYGEAGLDGRQFSGAVIDVKVTKRNAAGRARVVKVKTDEGEYELRADKMRWALRRPDGGPLRSTFFELSLEKRRGRVRKLVAIGRGWGHGVGMCQWGAIGMADRGSDYKEILHHYYTGVDIVRMYGPPA
jgi:stage II sporulation protein D